MKLARAILFFIATLLLYLGVPLLGWGVGDLAGFFAAVGHFGYAISVAFFSLAVGIQAYSSAEGIRGGGGIGGKLVFRQRLVRIGLVLFFYLALLFIPFFDRHSIGVFNIGITGSWIGIVFSALGFGMIFWSGVALGRQYSPDVTIQADHRLITQSIYRIIRHPRYLGVIALAIGVSCCFRSWIGLIAGVISTAILLFRINDEEAAMRKEFGGEWEAYCQRSWRLIPYIY